jgi:hypothetical protein
LLPVLWRLFSLFRKVKKTARILSGDYQVVSVNAILAVSDECKCKEVKNVEK